MDVKCCVQMGVIQLAKDATELVPEVVSGSVWAHVPEVVRVVAEALLVKID